MDNVLAACLQQDSLPVPDARSLPFGLPVVQIARRPNRKILLPRRGGSERQGTADILDRALKSASREPLAGRCTVKRAQTVYPSGDRSLPAPTPAGEGVAP